MSEKAIYSLVLVLYMGLLIIVGLLTSRKLRNVEDFYIGGRKVGPWVTALSYVAAYFSSVVIIGGGGFGYNGCSPELEYGYAAGTPHGLPFLATRGQLLLSGHSYSSAG